MVKSDEFYQEDLELVEEEREERPEGLEEGLAQALIDFGYAETLDHARARVALLTPRKRDILIEHLERTRKPPE